MRQSAHQKDEVCICQLCGCPNQLGHNYTALPCIQILQVAYRNKDQTTWLHRICGWVQRYLGATSISLLVPCCWTLERSEDSSAFICSSLDDQHTHSLIVITFIISSPFIQLRNNTHILKVWIIANFYLWKKPAKQFGIIDYRGKF